MTRTARPPPSAATRTSLMLPVQIMGAIFGKAIEHLPTNADEAKQYAQELTRRGRR
ncbi:MAG: hypothetical protein IPG71_14345 [bacterium]|nr:hypothetical protein [bacterium]